MQNDPQVTGWEVVSNHVVPLHDLREHSMTDCWCGPGDDEGIVVHHSMDRREQLEREEPKAS